MIYYVNVQAPRDGNVTSDYFGEHRGLDTLPGPFAGGEAEKVVWCE